MSIKKLKPITSSQRFRIVNNYDQITNNYPEKSLTKGLCKSGGRNNYGRMTMRYFGGGHKRKYRIIDFKRRKFGIPAIIKSIEYDPNRSSFIALLHYKDGEKRYIIAMNGFKIGQEIISGKKISFNIGDSTFLSEIPLGTNISCIELIPGQGAKIARSAGAYAQLFAKNGKYATLKFPSGEMRMVMINCMATIGIVSNPDHQSETYGKAGKNRHFGRRPRTRGVAMNPVDHPMGGGEGKASGGIPRSRKGFPSKGFRTRSRKKYSDRYILQRRKK
ncbi:MAG: 50S ribosomal protein L2 [Flavobacteriales bacterium]|jgi:large subunit ribosomal protein L2|uniref:50S ribosomal protein L2 n=1 Tax=Blattabacterium sp. (Mastotermes darwiniensis) TaxID=39768 RepID=UPI000231DE70|nr:50S ribosomal protein L2 [Blattabacterium sp. (Mastotermes darwiniensis)]AER40676.1 50S ribosomal protein L2 [Blattabacterium sp. (Mastotermes darwiniensis) str. MADAR]MDR1804796.1 50S ribosomal protein L2 [Flavobacteriales bacterium]